MILSKSMHTSQSQTFTTTVRVRYAETDQMGVVYYANFFVWFEVGRVELLRQIGFDYAAMEAEDCLLPVVEATCRYRSPARYDDQILIQTHVQNQRTSMIKFGYRILRSTGNGVEPKLIAEGETVHVFVNRALQKRLLPEKYSHALKAVAVKASS